MIRGDVNAEQFRKWQLSASPGVLPGAWLLAAMRSVDNCWASRHTLSTARVRVETVRGEA